MQFVPHIPLWVLVLSTALSGGAEKLHRNMKDQEKWKAQATAALSNTVDLFGAAVLIAWTRQNLGLVAAIVLAVIVGLLVLGHIALQLWSWSWDIRLARSNKQLRKARQEYLNALTA